MAAAEIITPPCELFAARLARPVGGWYVLAVRFDRQTASKMGELLRLKLVEAYGRDGRHAALPMTDLGDDCRLLRFVSRQSPRLVDLAGQRLIVEPGKGSILQIVGELRPMVSCVGFIPIMRQIRVREFVEAIAET